MVVSGKWVLGRHALVVGEKGTCMASLVVVVVSGKWVLGRHALVEEEKGTCTASLVAVVVICSSI